MKNSTLKNATTGLAGAVALAGGSQAYGALVTVTPPANFTPTSGATALTAVSQYDINGDGQPDIFFEYQQTSTTGNWLGGIFGNTNSFGQSLPVAYQGTYVVYANRLTTGTTISSASGFLQTGNYIDVLASRFSGIFYGQFTSNGTAQRGWAGFSFRAADGIHYGAIELTTTPYQSAANPGGFRFFTAEYQSTPGAPLVITAVPEPTSLAALAFGAAGAAGVVLRRRSKKAAAAQPVA